MLASKQLDPVVGVDIHWELVPTPAGPIPTPLPNPFVGMVFDPMGLAVGLVLDQIIGRLTGSPPTGAVTVNLLPATNTGTEAMGFGHIIMPPGTSWAPMPSVMPVIVPKHPPEGPDNPAMPDNDAIVITGSKTVHVMGTNFARFGDFAMSCSEPVRLPSSVVMAIPKGLPVLVGGPPTLDALAALGAFIRTQWVSHQLNNLLSHMRPGRLRNLLRWTVCFLTGHPVDVATGRVFTNHVDFELPGPLPLRFERVYNSGVSARSGPLGHGWSHNLDQRVWRERGKVVLLTDDGREVEFDTFHLPERTARTGDELYHPVERLTLKCLEGGAWEAWDAQGHGYEFGPAAGGDDAEARLLAMKTRDGHRVELNYDEHARLSWIRDSAHRQIRCENDEHGRLTALRLPLPRGDGYFVHTRFGYDEHGDLVAVSDPANHSWEFEYVDHLLVRETDREGLSFYFGYDGIGQDAWCIRTWGDGGIYDHELSYDKLGKVTCVTDSLGNTTTYRMDLVGVVVEIIDPHGASERFEHDPASLQVTSEMDALGNVERVQYDERGNAVRIEAPDGAVTTMEFDRGLGAPTRAVDPNGGVWRWVYDKVGRLRERHASDGLVTRFEYEGGRLSGSVAPGGARTQLSYDEGGNLCGYVGPDGAVTSFTLDGLGRAVEIRKPAGAVEERTYDLLGNLIELTQGALVRRQYAYDKERNLVSSSARGHEVRYAYTGFHQLHECADGDAVTRLHYDTEGQLLACENEVGERYSFELDERGLVRAETAFDGGTRLYTRDPAGRVAAIEVADGQVTVVQRDARGRVICNLYPDGRAERFEYRADGSLVGAHNDAVEVTFERDPMGRVTCERVAWPDGTETWVRSRFGADGRRLRVETSDGHVHHVERNASGDVVGVELVGRRWAVEMERDELGLEASRRLPGGVRCSWSRGDAGRPTARTVVFEPARVLDHKDYVWESDDLIGAIRGRGQGDSVFRHDARGRLVSARLPWGEELHRAFDDAGNVYLSPDRSDRVYARGGRITEAAGTSYRHDADGRLVERTDVLGDQTSYHWNSEGQLEAVDLPHGRRLEFRYDALGRRVSKTVTEAADAADSEPRERRWVWDGAVAVTELDSERGKTNWVFEPETFSPLAKLSAGEVWGVLTDHLGTPTELLDETGSLLWAGFVDVLGHLQTTHQGTAPDLRWPGQYADEETGLYYNRFRYYSPQLAAYISPDPLGLLGGLAAYAYVSSPLTYFDALGLIERFFRYVSEAEARQSAGNLGGDDNLHPRPHGSTTSRGPKWITQEGSEARVQRTDSNFRLDIEAEDGTAAWLREHDIDFEHVAGGESGAPGRVIRKPGEPGSGGVGVDLLDALNRRIRRITGRDTRARRRKKRRRGCR